MASRETIKEQAQYIVDNNATIRKTAQVFGFSKSAIHKNLYKLEEIDLGLYFRVREVLDKNKAERHIRGGVATSKKYRKMREKN